MPRFFCEPILSATHVITGADALHIAKSLRMKPGDLITMCDGKGLDYSCEIISLSAQAVDLKVLSSQNNITEPNVSIKLYQALPKADKLDFIVQKAVELGACGIIPVLTSRCISRPDAASMAKKIEKLSKTSLEAAKQAGRGIIPAVYPLLNFEDAVADMKNSSTAILFYENAQAPLQTLLQNSSGGSIAIMIGSEGGFSPEEAALAQNNGIALASLGKRILRCETASVAALAAILYATGNM